MKRGIVYISILLTVTAFMLVVFEKYYPSSIVEVYLKDYYSPDKISKTFNEKYPYEYLNLYEILSSEGNVSVYTGNLNIILRNQKIEDYGISIDTDTLIAGDKYIENKSIINTANCPVTTKFGEYYLSASIKNKDEAYFSDTDILKNNQIRRQRMYLILNDDEKVGKYINYETLIRLLKAEGIKVAVSISYKDVSDFLRKLCLIFCFALFLIVFVYMQKNSIVQIKTIIKKYKELKYDIYLRNYLLDKQNIKFLLTSIVQIILSCVLIIVLIILFVLISNIRLSFSLNPTSYTSIKNTIMLFVNLMSYFLRHGFSDISLTIAGIFFTYLVFIFLIYALIKKKSHHNKGHNLN